MRVNELAQSCLLWENCANDKRLMSGIPIVARLDGRSFSRLTKCLERPFDATFTHAMKETVKYLVEQFQPDIAYTQSDEITLVWKNDTDTDFMFSSRVQKLNSLLAASASVKFNQEFQSINSLSTFDCRIWSVPSFLHTLDVLRWRQEDAVRNSKQMFARAHMSHAECMNKSTRELVTILETQKGLVWDNLTADVKSGTFFVRRRVTQKLSDEELINLPELHEAHTKNKTEFERATIEDFSLRLDNIDNDEMTKALLGE